MNVQHLFTFSNLPENPTYPGENFLKASWV